MPEHKRCVRMSAAFSVATLSVALIAAPGWPQGTTAAPPPASSAAAGASAPRFLDEEIPVDSRTTVIVRHADLRGFDLTAGGAPPPPITVRVTRDRWTTDSVRITGDDGYPPWGYLAAFPRDIDAHQAVFVASFCNFGGSGGVRYLTIVEPRRGVAPPIVWTLPRGEEENVQTSTFFLARDEHNRPAIVITHPLMDGESRADPTHWQVIAYRLLMPGTGGVAGYRTLPVSKAQTSGRYAERAPESAVRLCLPRGWRIVSALY